MSRFNNLSGLATLVLVTLLVAPWIPKLDGASPQTTFNVTLAPGDSLLADAISSNGNCGTAGWPQLFARWDPGCFISMLDLVRASMSVQQKGGEVHSVGFFFRKANGDLYQTDRIPVNSADTPKTSACFTIHVHDTRQVYKAENPGKGTPSGNIVIGDALYCPNP